MCFALPLLGEGISMSTQRQAEIQKGSKLGNSENPWYNIYIKKKERQQARDILKKRRPPRFLYKATI